MNSQQPQHLQYLPEANMLPDVFTQTDATQLSPVAMASMHLCDRKSHSLTVLSEDPEAMMSSLSAYTAMICPAWPFSCPTVWPVLQSDIMIFPSPGKRSTSQGGFDVTASKQNSQKC